MARELFHVKVEVTCEIVVYCEREEAEKLALDSYEDERGNEDIQTLGPYPIKGVTQLPGAHWLDALPYTTRDNHDLKTVGELLARSEPHGITKEDR